jgi:hypothetical protein
MTESIIVALISAGLPTLATLITAILQSRMSKKHAAKQSIFQMILEDHMAVTEGHIPSNYQNILQEYDRYHNNGGNSYVTEKVDDYKKWYDEIEESRAKTLTKKA